MSIEGQEDELGRLTPICCATNVSSDVWDRFITSNMDYWNHPSPCYMVFVDDLSKTYEEESEVEDGPATTEAPFKDRTPQECYQILRKLRSETQSDISCPSFIVMDERSIQDDTVLLVEVEEGELRHVRAAFELAYNRLNAYEMGYPSDSMEADQEAAHKTEDGVLRADAIAARRRAQSQR